MKLLRRSKTKKAATKSKTRKSFPRPLLKSLLPTKPLEIALLALVIFVFSGAMMYYRVPFTRTEIRNSDIPYDVEYIQDSSLELGEQQTRQHGENGIKATTIHIRKTLSGRKVSETIVSDKTVKSPVNETKAQGTKRYQYMWCSNGSYRYYTNDQFKNSYTGFTHKSDDYCAQNGQGHMTGLADTAPNPTYNYTPAPIAHTPTITNCYDTGIYSHSFSCYSY